MILMLFAAVISSSTDGVRWMVKRVDVEAVGKMNCETVGKIDWDAVVKMDGEAVVKMDVMELEILINYGYDW